jgi:hypothetical protein
MDSNPGNRRNQISPNNPSLIKVESLRVAGRSGVGHQSSQGDVSEPLNLWGKERSDADSMPRLALSAGKYDQLRLFDTSKTTDEIKLWTSDQGFADDECHVTYDLDLVLRIAKHFGETGEPLPEAPWGI